MCDLIITTHRDNHRYVLITDSRKRRNEKATHGRTCTQIRGDETR